MAQNGLDEIKAVEAQVAMAKKAKARSSKNVIAAKAVVDAANKVLDDAKHEDEEADADLNKAVKALKDVNSKWEVIHVDIDNENDGSRKRAASVELLPVVLCGVETRRMN